MPSVATGKKLKVKTHDFASVAEMLRSKKSKKETQEPTIFDAVLALRKEIQELREKGYYFTEIAALLKESGIDVSPATLRQYMREAQRKKAAPSKSKGRIEAADQETPAAVDDMPF